MRTKINSIVAIILLCVMALNCGNKANASNSILIQSTNKNVSTVALTQSAKIISSRLKDFSSDTFELTIIPEKKQIQLIFTDNWNLKIVEKLLTQKGKIGFYKTYNRKSLAILLKEDYRLFLLLKSKETNHSDVRIGCCTITESVKVNNCLKSLGQNRKCKFVWSQPSDSSDICLYALRLKKSKGALLNGTDIESMKYGQEKGMKIQYVEINFRKPAIALWASITKHNIGNPIAIVLDNTLLCAPVVNQTIQNGKSQITGNFTETDVKLIAALGNNGELPISFEIVK